MNKVATTTRTTTTYKFIGPLCSKATRGQKPTQSHFRPKIKDTDFLKKTQSFHNSSQSDFGLMPPLRNLTQKQSREKSYQLERERLLSSNYKLSLPHFQREQCSLYGQPPPHVTCVLQLLLLTHEPVQERIVPESHIEFYSSINQLSTLLRPLRHSICLAKN